jgi:hypothetical protein
VLVAGSPVVISSEVKSLGVILDSTLSFTAHVDNVCKASGYYIRAIRHIRKSITEETAASIACALVAARIDYCNALLYGTSQQNTQKLQRVQNSLARAVNGVRKFDRITATLQRLHWLPISSRITYKLSLIVYKTITTGQPELSSLIKLRQPTRQLRSSSRQLLQTPDIPPSSVFSSRAFYYAAPTIWNSLPSDLTDNIVSLPVFKRKLKTHLFTNAYRRWLRDWSAPAILLS